MVYGWLPKVLEWTLMLYKIIDSVGKNLTNLSFCLLSARHYKGKHTWGQYFRILLNLSTSFTEYLSTTKFSSTTELS